MTRRAALLPTLLASILLAACGAARSPGPADPETAAAGRSFPDWPGWGGPRRDFSAPAAGLAAAWGEHHPSLLWERELGDGYSGIAVANGRLFTLHRAGGEEAVAALDAASGTTVWEHRYPAPLLEGMRVNYGEGPQATPLVVGDRVFTVGASGKLLALDAGSGAVAWGHDLLADFGGSFLHRGYGSSPLAFGDTLIVQVGGAGRAVMAFRRSDGATVWRSQDFGNSPASPQLIDLDGQTQLLVFMDDRAAGLDPATGELLWSHAHPSGRYYNISTPVWGEDRLLFLSSSYGGGSRVLRLTRTGGRTRVDELWHSEAVRVRFTNAVRAGGMVVASSGDTGAVPLTAVDVATGEIRWRDRAVGRANLLRLDDGRLLALDEDGMLFLARPAADGLEVLGRIQLFDGRAWTAPALSGKVLFARDQRRILALVLP